MPLDFYERLDIMRNTLSKGDFDLLVRAIKDPHLLTPDEQGTIADSLGMADGVRKWMVNLVTDPTVWIAGLLASRYPISLWSHGIPKRFVGAGNEFGGLSRLFRPVVQAFRGTGVEEAIALGMHRQAQVNVMAQRAQRALAALTPTESVALTRFREEGIKVGLTDRVLHANEELSSFMQNMWTKLAQVADVRGSPASGSISYGGFFSRVEGRMTESPRVPLNFRNLMPHLPITSTDGMMTISATEALTRLRSRGGKALESALKEDGFGSTKFAARLDEAGRPTAERIVTRIGPWRVDAGDVMQSSLEDFERMMKGTTGKMFFSHLLHRSRDLTIHGSGAGLFVTDVNQIFAHYVRGASRTYAFNSPLSPIEQKIGSFLVENPRPIDRMANGVFRDRMITKELGPEPLIVQIQKKALESMNVKLETATVKGTEGWAVPRQEIRFNVGDTPAKLQALDHLTMSLKGAYNDKDIILGSLFSGIATQAEAVLGAVSPKTVKQLVTHFEYLKSSASDRAKNNFLATYSYYTTLGGNLGSAFGNSLQTPLTTLPSVGLGSTMAGISEFLGRVPAYAAEVSRIYRKNGMGGPKKLSQSARDAFSKVYRELAEYKVDIDPRAFDVDEQALVSGAAGVDKIFENSQKYLDWLLLPFKMVETANRGIAFYAAKHAGAKAMRVNPHLIPTMADGTKMAGDALGEYLNLHSARTVNATQFLPGGGSRTIAQDSVAPWLRTFTSFPTRLLSWLGESTVRGAATEAEMQTAGMLSKMTGGRNFGTLARLYVSGRVLQTGFRDAMGLDVNRWVGFGPADAGQDLVIFPVPPIAGAMVATMKYLSSGDIDDLQPVNIPGVGKIPLPRTLVPGGVALNRLGRAIEQWDSDAGGMVDEDQRLMRRGGVKDQIMTTLGIPTYKARRERRQMASLQVRTQKIRDFRRKYAAQIMQGNLLEATRIKQQYAKTFPDMPPLNISVRDMNTMHKNSRIPRLAHRLKTIGGQAPYIRADLLLMNPEMILSKEQYPDELVGALGR